MSTTPPRPGSTEPISSASSVSQDPAGEPEQHETLKPNESTLSNESAAPANTDENVYALNIGVNLVPETDLQPGDEQPVTTSVPKELSPVSPVPLHVPEPSKIPLLLDPALSRTIPNEEQIPFDIGSALNDPSLAPTKDIADDDDDDENTGPAATLFDTTVIAPQSAASADASIQYQNPMAEMVSTDLVNVDTTMTGMLPTSVETAVEVQPAIEMRDRDTLSEPASAIQTVNLQALLANMANQNRPAVNDAGVLETVDPIVVPSGQIHAPQTMSSPITSLPPLPFQTSKNPHALPTPPIQAVPSISHPTNLRHPLPENPANATPTDSDEGEVTFTQEEERAYDLFLNVERDYVAKGEWSRFPAGSRLFIGNLSSERAFGFVQFFDVNSCSKALREEQGTPVRGRKMHLEISKPQRNTGRNSDAQANARPGPIRRSRSPDEPMSPRNRGSSYRGQGFADRESRNSRDSNTRGRDEYRPSDRRMSSPRSQYGRDREDYYPNRDYRDRSRSPRGRYRSPTPPQRGSFERNRQQIQPIDSLIVVFDDLDPAYIKYVDGIFRDRRLRTDVLHMTPRINLEGHIGEQVVHGCQAVVFLTRATQDVNKVSVQIFKGSSNNPGQYDEYDMINPEAAAELVRRACGGQPSSSQYGAANGYNTNQQYQTQAPPAYIPPNQHSLYPVNAPQPAPVMSAPLGAASLQGILQNLDQATLQTLLAQLQSQQQQQQPAHAATVQNPYMQAAQQIPKPADLSAMLGAVAGAQQQQQQQAFANLPSGTDYQNPALVSLLGGLNQRNTGSMQPQTNQQVQNIMSQLTGQWSAGR
ncbi:hypothetical protein AA313_de0201120 [Arthrobotrys entomopaga]|nr:hypothetical protein AA313_de0201120 [Arthrobotrys entomopaga]